MQEQKPNPREGSLLQAARRCFFVPALVLTTAALLLVVAGFLPRAEAVGFPGPASTGAGIPARGAIPAAGTAEPFRVRVRGLTVDGGTRAGDLVTVRMTIDTFGSGVKRVPWTIYRGNMTLKAETRENVVGGTSFEATATWQATGGNHSFYGDVDPANTLSESAIERRDNASQTVTRTFSDWGSWIEGAKRGMRTVMPDWLSKLTFSGIIVNGPTATGGRLRYPPGLKERLAAGMREGGAPQDVADASMGAVAAAWESWAGSVKVPGLPWYPAFAVWPGTVAPRMPNISSPAALLLQNKIPLQPDVLATAIRGRTGSGAGSAGEVDLFCSWVNQGFESWIASSEIQGVLGWGPVVSGTPPPFVSVGPVLGGTAEGGGFSGVAVWR